MACDIIWLSGRQTSSSDPSCRTIRLGVFTVGSPVHVAGFSSTNTSYNCKVRVLFEHILQRPEMKIKDFFFMFMMLCNCLNTFRNGTANFLQLVGDFKMKYIPFLRYYWSFCTHVINRKPRIRKCQYFFYNNARISKKSNLISLY